MEEWREGGAVMDNRDTGETDTLSGEQWREEDTVKGDWGQDFRIQDTSDGHFETVVCIHLSPAHEYHQAKHPKYWDCYWQLNTVQYALLARNKC